MTGDTETDLTNEVADSLTARADRVIETSCARVFLVGDHALKVKKPVDFGFLDYSTAQKRRWSIERELAFNRATAPDIYQRVASLTREPDGSLALDGAGPAVETVLVMRRFDETAVLAEQPWAVDGDLAEALGRTIARFHAEAPVEPEAEPGGALSYTIRSNERVFTGLGEALPRDEVADLVEATRAERARHEALITARRDAGWVRRCHGDLHLGNILLENGAPVLFDCIEFNDELSRLDVLYDVAFLLMDLDFRRRRDAAVRVLSAWLDEGARGLPQGLWEGLALLPLCLSTRAGVRCHVKAHNGETEAALAYLRAAREHLNPAPPVLAALGGLSGSGKSTLGRLTAPGLGASPGAVVLRSDEIRKRLFNTGPLDRLPPEAYAPEVSPRVYAQMLADAEACLKAGRAVVLDAVFLKPEERAQAEALAARTGVPFQALWLEAPTDVLKARVTARTGDASDADLAVLETQLTRDLGDITWRRADAYLGFEATAADLVRRLQAG